MLVVVSGLPGTGKTSVADAVARRRGALRISVDEVEEALLRAGHPPGWTTGVAAYEAAAAAAATNLALGHTVVVDAVNDSDEARGVWSGTAERAERPLLMVLLALPDAGQHRARLTGRSRGLTYVPEPTWDDVVRRAAGFAPWRHGPQLDASRPLDDVVADVMDLVPQQRLRLAVEDPAADDTTALLRRHLDLMRASSPPGTSYALDIDGLRTPEVTVVAARLLDGALTGVGALKALSAREVELKSMHVAAEARGTGAGRALLERLLDLAGRRGYRRALLETGTGDVFAPARALYASAGFVPCEPYGDYRPSPHNAFFALDLAGRPTGSGG